MRWIRQFVVLVALMFWQGGFMFYGGVVVPVGARILGSDTQQGFITQSVTNYLNVAGAVCLVVWAEHLWHERRCGVTRFESLLLAGSAVAWGMLVALHPILDRLLDSTSTSVLDADRFGLLHEIYIGISSAQWLAMLLLLGLALRRWNTQIAPRS